MPKYIRICPQCNIVFESKYKDRQFLCSRKCYNESRKIEVEKNCEHCNEIFIARTSEKLLQRFCSYACSNKVIHGKDNAKESRACKECNQEFETYTYRPTRFCSLDCAGKEYSRIYSEENSVHWQGGIKRNRGNNWSTQRSKARARDNDTCQICRSKKSKKSKLRVDVHHVKPYKEFDGDYKKANQLSNLVTLCRPCHVQVEHYGLACPRPLF